MTTLDFLQHLRSLGINVQVAGEQLQCKAPKGVLTPALRAELAERKQKYLLFCKTFGTLRCRLSLRHHFRVTGIFPSLLDRNVCGFSTNWSQIIPATMCLPPYV